MKWESSMRIVFHGPVAPLVLGTMLVFACQSAPTNRPVLVADTVDEPPPSLIERVEEIREGQEQALADFQRAHEVFLQLTRPQATDLSRTARELKRQAKTCEKHADQLARDITRLKAQSEELTAAWEAQLEQVTDDSTRKKGEKSLQETRKGTEKVIATLRVVQKNTAPVLVSLQDYLLFFDHNLNARAIATLDDTYTAFGEDVESLTKEIERTSDEIGEFLANMSPQPVQVDPLRHPVDPPVQVDPVTPDPDPVVDPVVPDPPQSAPPVDPDPMVLDPVVDPPVDPLDPQKP